MNKIEKLRNFILENGYKGTQAFNSRNLLGDSMTNIYEDKENGVIVDFCHYYNYLEIFGLSDEEYKSLKDILDVY